MKRTSFLYSLSSLKLLRSPKIDGTTSSTRCAAGADLAREGRSRRRGEERRGEEIDGSVGGGMGSAGWT